MPERHFSSFAWGVLGYSLLVILWGYFLRISESGDGCGTDWPLCHGAVVPTAAEFPTWVEFIHRASSGLVLLLVIILAAWAFRRLTPGHAVTWAAGLALLFTISESLFGAVLVVLGWVATDISLGRIIIRPFHVTNTFFLMAALALTAWWSTRGIQRIPGLRHPDTPRFLLGALGVLALAWTGSWTGLAGTAYPAGTIAEGIGQYLSPDHLLIYLRVAHPIVAVIVVVYLARLVVHTNRGPYPPIAKRLAGVVGAMTGLQVILGPLTILMLYPTGLRLLHLLVADLLWIGLLFLASEILSFTPARSSPTPPDSAQSRPGAAQPG